MLLLLPIVMMVHEMKISLCNCFRNILYNGFSEPCSLQYSGQHDSVLCGLAADIDFDGNNEILLGTYGQASYVLHVQISLVTLYFFTSTRMFIHLW